MRPMPLGAHRPMRQLEGAVSSEDGLKTSPDWLGPSQARNRRRQKSAGIDLPATVVGAEEEAVAFASWHAKRRLMRRRCLP